jgi:membrane fusion protein, multidrug efflux system
MIMSRIAHPEFAGVRTMSRETHSPVGAVRKRLTPRRVMLAGAALLAVSAAGWFGDSYWTHGRFIESTDDAYVGGDVTTIAPKVPGFIAAVAVADNQAVHAGDLLIRLDDRDYRAALARADAAVAGQRATLLNLAATRHLQQAVVAEAQAELSATAAESDRAHYDYARYQVLAEDRWASQQRFQTADSDYRKAQAADRKARATLEAASLQIGVIDTQTEQARAALAASLADRETARLNLSYTELRAPIDGTVGNRSARPGAYATVGGELISLVPAHGLWVDANFKEDQLAEMRPGQAATVTADVLRGQTFHGHVASLAPATGAQFSILPPENATGNFTKIVQRVPVRILLEGDGGNLGLLRPGLSVVADVDRRGGAQ